MAVPFKAPVKDITFGYEVIDSYNILNKISEFGNSLRGNSFFRAKF